MRSPLSSPVRALTLSRPKEQYDMLREFSQFLSWRDGDAIILAEANVLPDTDMHYFGESGERLQMMFNFEVNQHLFYAMASRRLTTTDEAMLATSDVLRPRSGASFCAITTNSTWAA